MPGGFHPFHAGHFALYQSAQRAFPGADVYVAATNDTSTRPFPFQIKEKLAKLAGVQPGHFVQVKSPFKAEEITRAFNPNKDVLIFVRSEKDAEKPPKAGGIKKDGTPAYLQPLLDATKLEPFGKHAYMAYLPTVEFGPGMTSATEIRTAWPGLNEKRKTALVMSLYPKTQSNPKLAATVVKMLDTAMGGEELNEFAPGGDDGRENNPEDVLFRFAKMWYSAPDVATQQRVEQALAKIGWEIGELESEEGGAYVMRIGDEDGDSYIGWPEEQLVQLNEFAQNFVGGMYANYQARENQPVDENQGWAATLETKKEKPTFVAGEVESDPQLKQTKLYAKQHYLQHSDDPEVAFDKWLTRGLKHSEENDIKHDAQFKALSRKITDMEQKVADLRQRADYLPETSIRKNNRII